MIYDFDTLEDGLIGDADICVIGSGTARITIAREFFNIDIKVTTLESGGVKLEDETQKLYAADVIGIHHAGITDKRVRVLGGTTTLWAGQSLPLHPLILLVEIG